jgi:hypothetical protein
LTNALAIALGFTTETHLLEEAKLIRTLLDDGASLTPLDAARALAATEIVFASDVFGSGVEWESTTGLSDEDTIRTLRVLQRKLAGEYTVVADGIEARTQKSTRYKRRLGECSGMHPE